jgi:NAD(P)-dependent dehydrogenase (short-subunit alcohol dehydrogenase family)
MELSAQVTLITGASGGIGRALGRNLATHGSAVALAFGRHREPPASSAEG